MNRTKAIARQYVSSCNGTPGFTLAEMSIVLVIVGLVAGGVLVGREMIKTASLKAIVSEKESFETAVSTFKIKYNCLPGDCATATNFFGADSGWVGGYGFKSTNNGPLTANGNGDGRIEWFLGTNSAYRFEGPAAWQQLSYAGLITGPLDGTWQTASAQFVPGVNAPRSKNADNLGWIITTIDASATTTNYPLFAGYYGNSFVLTGRLSNGTTGWGWGEEALTPLDQQSIDTKIDDGKPGTGMLRGAPNGGYGLYCVGWGQNNPDTATYNITYTKKACSPVFSTRAF